jgi:hypothetical protein
VFIAAVPENCGKWIWCPKSLARKMKTSNGGRGGGQGGRGRKRDLDLEPLRVLPRLASDRVDPPGRVREELAQVGGEAHRRVDVFLEREGLPGAASDPPLHAHADPRGRQLEREALGQVSAERQDVEGRREPHHVARRVALEALVRADGHVVEVEVGVARPLVLEGEERARRLAREPAHARARRVARERIRRVRHGVAVGVLGPRGPRGEERREEQGAAAPEETRSEHPAKVPGSAGGGKLDSVHAAEAGRLPGVALASLTLSWRVTPMMHRSPRPGGPGALRTFAGWAW